MAVTTQLYSDGMTMTIAITGRFDFSVHKDLRKAYEGVGRASRHYIVDLLGASYMDSSALGMLLQLREYAGSGNHAICVKNAGPGIREILRIANFDKLIIVE